MVDALQGSGAADFIEHRLQSCLYLQAEGAIMPWEIRVVEYLVEDGGSHAQPHVHVLVIVQQPLLNGVL